MWLLVADALFWSFHTVLILFNLFGWIPARLRKWNLVTLGATLISWLVMGLAYGIGYCICTDYHFQVRRAMGIEDNADTYLQLLVRKISGWDPPLALVNNTAAVCLALAVSASLFLNIRDWRRARSNRS